MALVAGQAVTSAPAWADPGSAYIVFGGLTSLGPTDDGSSLQTPLGFTLDYFGTDYSSVYVNENGDLTFSGPLSSYTPSGIGTVGTDIIAPFFADADSEGGGGNTLYGATTLDGYSAFVAEWPYVDCYTEDGTASDVENDFEVILTNRPDLGAGDFQIEYNYDQVQWDAGEASNGTASAPECQSTVNGDAAVVGFSNASGSKSYELPGSQSDGAFIDSNSSTGLINNEVNSDTSVSVPASDSPVQGRYIWEVENGSLGTPTFISGSLTSASDSGTSITVTPNTAVEATSNLSGDNAYEAAGTLSYTVYSGSGCTGSVYESAGLGVVTDGSPGPSSPVTISAPGTYSWYASYSGDESNNQASAACIATETVEKANHAPLAITSTSGTATVPLTLTTSGGSGTGAVSYVVADGTASGCAVSSGALSSTSAGTCLVTATQAGDVNYNPISSNQTTVTLALANQAISFSAPTVGTVGTAAALSATGGASGNPVVLSVDASSGSGVCAVSGTDGTTVSYSAVGNCVIDADQAGNADYLPAPEVTRTIGVVGAPARSRAGQTISFAPLPKRAPALSAVTVRASASSGLAVSFSTTTPRVCSALRVRGGAAVALHRPGTCTVVASQVGNAQYAPADTVSGSFTVFKAAQTIRFVPIPHRALAGSTIIVRASASSGLRVSFTEATPSVCILAQTSDGVRLTLLRAGKCTVGAHQAGNAIFSSAAPIGESLTVSSRPRDLGAENSEAGASHVPWQGHGARPDSPVIRVETMP